MLRTNLRQLMFRAFYRLGFVPWDGHPIASSLQRLLDGGLTPGNALDIGCGTGDNAILLAQHGWQVTGVDFAGSALDRARTKASERGVTVTFVEADATALDGAGIGDDFTLIIDSGCLHGMIAPDRHAYVRSVTAVSSDDAELLIVAFLPGKSFGVAGVWPEEMDRLFAADWELAESGDEPALDHNGKNLARYYRLTRRHGRPTDPAPYRYHEFQPYSTERAIERLLDRTKHWPEPIRRMLWGPRR